MAELGRSTGCLRAAPRGCWPRRRGRSPRWRGKAPGEGAVRRGGQGQWEACLPPGRQARRPGRERGGRETIFVPFGSSPPPHSLVTKSTGTSSERIISEGQHIAAQAAGKAPKFTPRVNNPLPIARSGDSVVVPTGRIPPGGGGG